MGSAIEAIVFDKDGTLFDFQASWSVAMAAVLDRIAPGDPAAADAIGFDLAEQEFRLGSIAIAGTALDLGEALSPFSDLEIVQLVALIDEVASAATMVPVVDLAPCLERLGRGRRLGLVTNDTEMPARAHLEGAGVAHFFEFVAGYDSGYGAKPGPGQLLAFAEATGVAPDRTLMVGDSPADLVAGQRAGMRPVGVLTGVAGAKELGRLAEVVLTDIGHLPEWIGRLDGQRF